MQAHGGQLKDSFLSIAEVEDWKPALQEMPSWYLTDWQLCDIKLLMSGGFSPLDGFLTKADYGSVLTDMRLTNGLFWPMPVTLDVTAVFAKDITIDSYIALRNQEGLLLAIMQVSDCWQPDKVREAQHLYGTTDESHPGVFRLNHYTGDTYVGGKLLSVQLPKTPDFIELRNTPHELQTYFTMIGAQRVVGFHTCRPIHQTDYDLTTKIANELDALLLIQPGVGISATTDIDHYTRVKCYKQALKHYPQHSALLSLLPLAVRMAGAREALWHAIIRKNYGCSDFIIDEQTLAGEEKTQIASLLQQYNDELGINVILVKRSKTESTNTQISERELKQRLETGQDIPEWFSFPEVIDILRERFPPKRRQGFCLFLTGLSGAGKSTIAKLLKSKLMENTGRPVTLLDGDLVRLNLSKGLGFSREDRDANVKRIGFVASEITKNHGIAICAPIAPYADTRRYVREHIEQYGGFIEVYLSTPLAACEERDPKGLYRKARAGLIKDFTGIDDPYEAPIKPELQIDTSTVTPLEAVDTVINTLVHMGYIDAIETETPITNHIKSAAILGSLSSPLNEL
ncbi:MAG: adenylyl-sulfate kinase [Legionellales bacterium]|nr:adenylyl-sulfate kinase [Legionellales bacterium]|tara:strand:+ start:13764 stop:15476 length:1713 start_codon:yes stop_codon:yes gene_type:complete